MAMWTEQLPRTPHSEGPCVLGVQCSAVTLLKFLIIFSLNLCFVSEDWWASEHMPSGSWSLQLTQVCLLSAPHFLAAACASPGVWGPAHPHPPHACLSHCEGLATRLCSWCAQGVIHVILWPSAPSGALGLGLGWVGVLHMHLGETSPQGVACLPALGWQQHYSLGGDSPATGLLSTSSPGTEHVLALRLQSLHSPCEYPPPKGELP